MWGPWDTIFVIEGYLGTPRGTPGGPESDFNGFGIDLTTLFGSALDHVGDFFVIWDCKVARWVPGLLFLVNWEWKSHIST